MSYLCTEAVIAFSAGHRIRRTTVEGRGYAPWPGIDGQSSSPSSICSTGHDTSRFLTIAGDDRASVRLGSRLLVTFPGAPRSTTATRLVSPGHCRTTGRARLSPGDTRSAGIWTRSPSTKRSLRCAEPIRPFRPAVTPLYAAEAPRRFEIPLTSVLPTQPTASRSSSRRTAPPRRAVLRHADLDAPGRGRRMGRSRPSDPAAPRDRARAVP
jgi:hypothetical protein